VDLVLHIGRHKTGTTAIQRHLQAVVSSTICFPQAGRQRTSGRPSIGHHSLVRLLQSKNDGSQYELEAMALAMRSEAEGADIIVLSSEYFSLMDTRGVERARWFFERLQVHHIRIVVYLRESLSYAVSHFQQVVQTGSHHYSLPLYLAQYEELPMAELRDRWDKLGTVLLRPYDRALLMDGDIVSDFIAASELPLVWIQRSRRDPNPSIAGNLLAIKAILNRAGRAELADFTALRALALDEPRFRGRLRVPTGIARDFRTASRFNDELKRLFPQLSLVDLSIEPVAPDLASFDQDLTRIADRVPLSAEVTGAIRARRDEARAWFYSDLA
jgi:hypothetical protein